MQRWLKSEECGGLSVSQTGGLLALVCMRSGTNLGEYLKRSIEPGSDDGNRGRQREVLPLPLWADGKEQLRSLFESGDFRKFGGTDKKAFRHARRAGLLIWHCLAVVVLNFLWTGGGKQAKVHRGTTSVSQARGLWIGLTVKAFVDDSSETKTKVPRSPEMGEWGRKVGDVRSSYQGEIVEKGQRLTLDQVLPGLPPAGYGASIPLVELCEGELKEKLLHPLSNLLSEEEMPVEMPRPQIHASREEWEKIAGEMYTRGLVKTVEAPVLVRGRYLVNGSFGVAKPGKYLDDERPVLRLIMDFRGTNAATRVLDRDVRTLTGAPALQHVVLPAGKVVRMSAHDLASAFNLFALPPGWPEMMTFAEKVSGSRARRRNLYWCSCAPNGLGVGSRSAATCP